MQKSKSIHNAEYTNLIKQLVQERKKLKLSQNDVASSLNMTQSDISKIENNERRIDILELRKLLKIYKVDENIQLKEIISTFFS